MLRSSCRCILLLIWLVTPGILGAQETFSPIDLTNRALDYPNDASAVGWNPSLLGVAPTGIEFLGALPYASGFSFDRGLYGLFAKLGPIGGGIIGSWSDSLENGLRPGPNQYFAGFGLPVMGDYLWLGGGVRWLDGRGFINSGEWGISATIHLSSPLLTSISVENITANNETDPRFNINAAYRLFEWGSLFAGMRYNGLDTIRGESPLRLSLGAGVGIFDDALQINWQYDVTRSSFRVGLEYAFGGDEVGLATGAISEWGRSSGMQGGAFLVRSFTRESEGTTPAVGTFPPPFSSSGGWAPDRSYTPIGLDYKYSTTDALASGDAMIRPCDQSASEFDTPTGLATKLKRAGSPYTALVDTLKRLAPNPNDIYKAVRQEYYTPRVRNRELQSGDSLSLLSRQGYGIGIQKVDASAFPQVSLVMQVNDAEGRTVRGLQRDDFLFRDSAINILSVKPIDSSYSLPVDLVMIIDCSGSMGDEISAVRSNVESFVNSMAQRGADYRIGGVLYGSIIYDTLHPTSDLSKFKAFAANAAPIGGDEITSLAIKAATEMNFRPGSQRVFVLITDDWQIQDNARLTEPDLVEMLWNTRARLYTIGNPCNNNGAVMTRLSLGHEYNITSSFNSILDEIGADVTTLYQLSYMSRIKAEEVAPKVTILRGHLRDETGRPARLPIGLKDEAKKERTIRTNTTTGEYETEIIEGMVYTATISGEPYLPLSEQVDLRGVKKGDTVIHDFTLRLPPTSIAGTVRDENGRAVTAEVRIDDAESGERVATLRTGADGRYDTLLMEGRSYRLIAVNPDYIPETSELDTRGVERGTKIKQDLQVTSIEQAIRSGATFKVKNIFFDSGKWDLRSESNGELERLLSLLNEYPRINVEIGAHTDAVGTDTDNQTLSQNRARSVVEFLIGRGIVESRLRAKGYGESTPIASNDTEEGRGRNRRVEFKLVR